MKTFKEYKNIDEALEFNAKDLVRYIPTGSNVQTTISGTTMKMMITTETSAPPLTTKDLPGMEKRLRSDIELFIKDVESKITLKSVDEDKYIFVKGVKNAIQLIWQITLTAKNKTEMKKLLAVDSALSFYKERKLG